MAEFEVKGPYTFQPDGWPGRRTFTRQLAATFKQKHEDVLSNAGCFVFALKAAKGYTPWYIGKTDRSFDEEVFTTDKLQKFNEAVAGGQRGTPQLFFLVAPGRAGASRSNRISELETYLVQSASKKNPNLITVHGAREPDWGIKGILRSARGSSSASSGQLKKVMSW